MIYVTIPHCSNLNKFIYISHLLLSPYVMKFHMKIKTALDTITSIVRTSTISPMNQLRLHIPTVNRHTNVQLMIHKRKKVSKPIPRNRSIHGDLPTNCFGAAARTRGPLTPENPASQITPYLLCQHVNNALCVLCRPLISRCPIRDAFWHRLHCRHDDAHYAMPGLL